MIRFPEPVRRGEVDLEELARLSAETLQRLALPEPDPRTGERPDGRMIRFYRTVRLMDPPLRYDGPRALYGFRHLLQVVTIKALQRQGLPLARIRERIAGLGERELEALVGEAGRGKAGPLAVRAAPPAAPPGQRLALDLVPGLTVQADLGRAREIAARAGGARERFEEALQLIARLARGDKAGRPLSGAASFF